MRRSLVLLIALLFAACTATPTAVPLRLLDSWQPQTDTLTPQDALRGWRFSGQAGDAIRLRLNLMAGGAVTLTLQDDAGNTLAQGSDLSFTLPASGFYTALVRLDLGEATTYRLFLTYTDRPPPSAMPTATFTPSATYTPSATFTPSDTPTTTFTPTPIYATLGTLTGQLQIDAALDGTFLSSFERHIYTFDGTVGQQVSISMTGTSGSVDPVLTLFDPDGQPIATDDNSGGGTAALLRDLRLPVNGEYIVQALGGGAGGYRISLQAEAPPVELPSPTVTPPLGTSTPSAADPDGLLRDHVLVVGAIERPGTFNRFFIQAQAGSVLTVAVIPASGLTPRLELYNPAGELMLSGDPGDSEVALISGLGVVASGKYAVFVSGDSGTTGGYTIAYGHGDSYTDQWRGSLPPETAVTGGDQRGVRDVWSLTLTSGDILSIEAPGAALDLIAPDGSSSASGQGSLAINAAQTGEYRLSASGAAFSLIWHRLNAVPTPGASVVILTVNAVIPAQTYQYYPFQGTGGQHLQVHVQAVDPKFDPVADLLDSRGAVVAHGDDSPNSLNPDFTATLPADGTYRLRVNGYGSAAGAVSITIAVLP